MDSYINSPENQELLQRLINDPNTVDFVVRRNQFINNLIIEYEIAVAFILSGGYAICYANAEVFEEFRELLGAGAISNLSIPLGLLDRTSLESSGIVQVHTQPFLGLRGQGVLIGILDTGIDYTLDVFRYEDGTSKIKYIYDQTAAGPPPDGYYFGTEYSDADINEALLSDDPYGIVPETDESGHGTFLSSVAAGRESTDFISAAPDSEIIMVKLRKARQYYLDLFSVPPEQEYAFESTAIMIGIDYILRKAQELKRPVAIILGLGSNFGTHDAYSIFEEYMSNISNLVGVCLCIAAGNESQAGHHTYGAIPARGETRNIDIKVGENAYDFYMSIWTGVSDRISVSIRSPTGEFIPRIPARSGQITNNDLVLENASVRVAYYYPIEVSGGQLTAIKIINPTPGIWTVTVFGDLILDGAFHSWLPMRGFVSPSIEYLSPDPNFTVTVPATMDGAITVGGYNAQTQGLYSDTSWGPTRTGMLAPDFVAPSVGVEGFFPYGKGTLDGTSVAAAITAGAAALMLEWGIVRENDPALSTYQIRAYLIRGCNRVETMTYPNNRWGYGTLDLLRSFELMREI